MLGLPVLVAGLILLLAGPSWFSGQHSIGAILTVVGAAVLLFQLIMVGVVLGGARGTFKRF